MVAKKQVGILFYNLERCFLKWSKQIKLGDLSPSRDFNFVKDTARGFLALAESDETIGKEINIASNFEISTTDTLNLIKDIM